MIGYMRQQLLFCFLLCVPCIMIAQVGGNTTYNFLRFSPSARITSLGGSAIASVQADPSFAFQNPSLINAAMHNRFSFQQSVYIAGSTFGTASYSYSLQDRSLPITLFSGLTYVSFGQFNATDPVGNITGQFNASEYALVLGASYQFSPFLTAGINIKPILSYLGPYNSFGIAMDMGATYCDTAKNITLSVVFRNIGSQFSTYARNGNLEPLPFDIQIGFSHRLKYIPLKFSVILHDLHQWGIVYDDPALSSDQILLSDGQDQTDNSALMVVDDIFRHFIFNLELLFGKKGKEEIFRVSAGYNHQTRGELGVSTVNNLSGCSFGFGIRIKQFNLDYGFGAMHYSGASHHIGLSVNIDQFLKGSSR